MTANVLPVTVQTPGVLPVQSVLPDTYLIPGVGAIGRVASNGFRQTAEGRLRPVVSIAQKPCVPLNERQNVADRLADTAIGNGVAEMDAVVRAAMSEQKI